MFIQTEDYIIEYGGQYLNPWLCSSWEITLTEYPDCPFMIQYNEEGDYEGEMNVCYDSKYSEDFKLEMESLMHKLENAINFLKLKMI